MTEFNLDEAALEEIASLPEVLDACASVAEQLAEEVVSLTPVLAIPQTEFSDAAAPGEMAASIDIQPIEGGIRVLSEDHRFQWIEFGTGMREDQEGASRGEMPAFAPFTRAAESFDTYKPFEG